MAQIFNGQRVRGVRVLDEGATLYNMMQVRGVRAADEDVLFSGGLQTVGVDVLDADRVVHNDQLVMGVVLITDDRALYNGLEILPAWALTGSLGGAAALTPDDYWAFVEPSDAPGATGASLTSIASRGAGMPPFVIAATGSAPTKEANAIRFNGGQYFISDGLTIPAGDGFILAADFTPNTVTGTQNVISIFTTSGVILGTIRLANTAAQYNVGVGINGSAANVASGTAVIGTRVQMAIEFDRVAGTLRHWNLATGAVVSQALAYSGPINAVRISIGQSSNHSVHKATVVTRATGAAWGTTLNEVLTDYGLGVAPDPEPEPVPFTVMRIHTSTGQSLALGLNMGGIASPGGAVWRTVLSSASVRMLTGHRRKDAVAITSVSSPLLGGYDTGVPATGDAAAVALGNVPPSFIGAIARAREGLPAGTGISYQFHGAGGQSLMNLDSSTAEGTTVIPWENFTFSVGQQAAYWAGRGVAVNCPVFSFNQGEADISQARNWWLDRFTVIHNETVTTVRAATGQTTGPRLYLYQTGGYMNKTGAHLVVLDQLDAIRNLNGVLVAPNYWQKIGDAHADAQQLSDGPGVHMGVQGYMQLGELENWAITEIEAGNGWTLLPPTTATRIGDTITIPITVRPDETLTTSPGKYTDFGGDPANLGLEVEGGGSITSASVSGGNIVVGVTGSVTGIRYAFQTTGIDYRTLTDAAGDGYATHRGIIRTTLTRTRTVGGLVMTLERAVPSFSIPVFTAIVPADGGPQGAAAAFFRGTVTPDGSNYRVTTASGSTNGRAAVTLPAAGTVITMETSIAFGDATRIICRQVGNNDSTAGITVNDFDVTRSAPGQVLTRTDTFTVAGGVTLLHFIGVSAAGQFFTINGTTRWRFGA